jgi:hypothetical protein
VVRGRDDQDRDLVIAREYISHGMRERAAEILSLDLGPKTDLEIDDQLGRQVPQERWTDLDKALLREAAETGEIQFGRGDAFLTQHLRAGRLQNLARLGLAEEFEPGRWHLAEDVEVTLRRLGERGDIIKTMHRELASREAAVGIADYAIYDGGAAGPGRLVGRVAGQGIADEDKDTRFLILEGTDGRAHYVDIGAAGAPEDYPTGSIVGVRSAGAQPRKADQTVADVAHANGGVYSVEAHQRHDPSASREFIEAHVRRLEAMRRVAQLAGRTPDGTWRVASDHVARGVKFDQGQGKGKVGVELLSTTPLETQCGAGAATWLDRELTAQAPIPLRDAGFGRALQEALVRRRQWLISEGLAREDAGRTLYRGSMIAELNQRELSKAGGDLARQLAKPYASAQPGKSVDGIYRSRIDLVSGRFAVIEKSKEFTLVPWRPVLEQSLGKPVAGIMRAEAVSWSIGRTRGPGIS